MKGTPHNERAPGQRRFAVPGRIDAAERNMKMRYLYVKRQRALACFGTAYHCVLNQPLAEHLAWAETQDRETLMRLRDDQTLRNGETICMALGEGPGSLFVIAYLENRNLTTRELPIPPGDQDLLCTVVTEFDGNRRISLELVPGDPDLSDTEA